jgi:hypothetical protein
MMKSCLLYQPQEERTPSVLSHLFAPVLLEALLFPYLCLFLFFVLSLDQRRCPTG